MGGVVLFLCCCACLAADRPPGKGDAAPVFEGRDQDGKSWKLADRLGKTAVLLYFYPRDETPGCTKEACGFRDQFETLKKAGVEVVGVSYDSAESHLQFIGKHQLNFTLLADTDGRIAQTYGVQMAGKNMARRVSFLIGTDGKVAHVTDTMDADTHLKEMKAAAETLAGH